MGERVLGRADYTQLQKVRNKRFPQVRRRSHIDFCEKASHINKLKISKSLRKQVIVRDNNICQFCGVECFEKKPEQGITLTDDFLKDFLTIDHLLPRSYGGGNTLDNLVVACGNCNLKKANKLDV